MLIGTGLDIKPKGTEFFFNLNYGRNLLGFFIHLSLCIIDIFLDYDVLITFTKAGLTKAGDQVFMPRLSIIIFTVKVPAQRINNIKPASTMGKAPAHGGGSHIGITVFKQ
jgi:hypothetical protein